MNFRGLLALTIIVSLVGAVISKFRGFPRRGRSNVTKRDQSEEKTSKDVFEMCSGAMGFLPPQPFTSPDDSDNVTLIVSPPAQWILRDTSSIPDPFLPDDVYPNSLFFCLEGNRRLYYIYNYKEKKGSLRIDTYDFSPPDNSKIYDLIWKVVSIRDSPVVGNIIVDVRMYTRYCCVALAGNFLYIPNSCSCDDVDEDRLVISLHAVKFLPDVRVNCPECWAGLFMLCSSADCSERIISLQVDNQIVPLLPMVLWTFRPEMP